MRNPGALGVVRLQPSVSGEMLVPPSPTARDAAALEWVLPAAAPPSNRPPVAVAGGPYVVSEGGTIRLDGSSSSDPDGDSLAGQWTLRGVTHAGLVATVSADDDLVAEARLAVSDGRGGSSEAAASVMVQNVAPLADAGPDRTAYWGIPVVLAGTASDPGPLDVAAGLAASWEAGDGGTGAGASLTHVYGAAGLYAAVLTVRDKDGGTGTDEAAVQVGKRPLAIAYTGPSTVTTGSTFTASARLSDAVDASSARLAGLTVTITVGAATATAVSDAGGLVTFPGLTLPAGTAPVTLAVAEGADYLAAGAAASIEATAPGCVVAWELHLADGSWAAFLVNGAELSQGYFAFSGAEGYLAATAVSSLTVSPDALSASFSGTLGGGRSFRVEIEDVSPSGAGDRFRLWVDGVPQTSADGALASGNVTILTVHP
jgi:hypothetical protein